MPYREYPDGLYLMKQKSQEKGVDHYGILDIGHRLRVNHSLAFMGQPVVIHQVTTGIRADPLIGSWMVLGRITDEAMANERLRMALQTPNYDLFGNNCEHFARFVATGRRESTQLQGLGILAGLAVCALFLMAAE